MARLSSRAGDGEEGLRGELRDIRKEIAAKKKAGKDVSYLNRELEKTKLKLAAYQREATKKPKVPRRTSWFS